MLGESIIARAKNDSGKVEEGFNRDPATSVKSDI